MNITDIIALAKQGYKPGDIKELITLAESQTTETVTDTTATDAPPMTDEMETKEISQPSQDDAKEAEYKKQIEDLNKKIEEQTALISRIQKDNQKTDLSGNAPKSIDEQLLEIGTSLY